MIKPTRTDWVRVTVLLIAIAVIGLTLSQASADPLFRDDEETQPTLPEYQAPWTSSGQAYPEGQSRVAKFASIQEAADLDDNLFPGLAADFDGNDKVDFQDFAFWLVCYGTSDGDENFDPKCDLDDDGKVELDDFFLFADDFGKVLARGDFEVTSDPPGASIFINGVDTGEVTPFTFTNKPLGGYTVRVKLEGQAVSSEMPVDVSWTIASPVFVLSPLVGSIEVTSDPEGARIFIDGEDTRQVTPYTFRDKPVGEYTVSVELEGYDAPFGQAIEVNDGQRTALDFELRQWVGSIEVTSDPEGARIFINGVDTGQVTPYTFTDKPVGAYSVRVTMEGRDDPSPQEITVADGRLAGVDFELLEPPIVFADSNLETMIRSAIDKPTGDIRSSDVRYLTSFNATGREIESLEGIEHLTSLEFLIIFDNHISDLSPLASLTYLRSIGLSQNNISDLSPLADLPNLYNIDLRDNLISDISPLAGITSLDRINCNRNQISDVSALVDNEGFRSGDSASFWENPLSDLAVQEQIPILLRRGVKVYPPCQPGGKCPPIR